MSRSLFVASAVAAGVALLVTLALAAAGLARVFSATGGAGGDFLSFYAAGQLVRTNASSLYDVAAQGAAERSLYPGTLEHATGFPLPAFAAWAFAALAVLPFAAAYGAWTGINIALLAAIVALLAREVRDVPALPRKVFLLAFATSIPVVVNVVFGQVDFIVVGAMLGGWVLLRERRPGWAGVALALVVIKPQFLIGVVPMLALTRQWRVLAALCGVGGVLIVVPALLTDPELLMENARYVTHYPGAGSDLQVNAAMMSNWRGLVVSVTGSDNLWLWAPGLAVIAIAAGWLAIPLWRAGVSSRGYALAAMLPLLISPHVHTQSLSLLVIPAALALQAHFAGSAVRDQDDEQRVTAMLCVAYVVLLACWLSTALGFAPYALVTIGAFALAVVKWPAPAADGHVRELREAA